MPISEFVTFEDLSSHIHPADRDRIKAGFAATEGIVNRIMFGIFIDVTGRKQAEEGDELLAGEMVGNCICSHGDYLALGEDDDDMAPELTHRLTALGRAHDLVRPLPGQEGKQRCSAA